RRIASPVRRLASARPKKANARTNGYEVSFVRHATKTASARTSTRALRTAAATTHTSRHEAKASPAVDLAYTMDGPLSTTARNPQNHALWPTLESTSPPRATMPRTLATLTVDSTRVRALWPSAPNPIETRSTRY